MVDINCRLRRGPIPTIGEAPETDQNTAEVNGTSADLLRMALETINEFARRSSGSP